MRTQTQLSDEQLTRAQNSDAYRLIIAAKEMPIARAAINLSVVQQCKERYIEGDFNDDRTIQNYLTEQLVVAKEKLLARRTA